VTCAMTSKVLLHHLALKTHDCDKLKAFYCRLFKIKPTAERYDERGQLVSVWLRFGATILMIERSTQKRVCPKQPRKFSDDPAGWHLTAFAIKPKDRSAWLAHLKQLKIKIQKQTPYSLYFFDPDFNRLALSHYPKKAQ